MSAPLRKRTVFAPCDRHSTRYASLTRARTAEFFVEGGDGAPCRGGHCAMKPGTDFYTAEFVTAYPTYRPGDDQR